MSATLDHRQLYRLPWSLPDNAIAWLEPTKKCNLACLGCYRENDPRGHKTLDEVRHDLEVFKRFRTVDGVFEPAARRSVQNRGCLKPRALAVAVSPRRAATSHTPRRQPPS